jgi:hypothetical protein
MRIRESLIFVDTPLGVVAFLGVNPVGILRASPRIGTGAEWCSLLPSGEVGGPRRYWRRAHSVAMAQKYLGQHVADWYDALHQPVDEAQARNIAASLVASR